MVNPGVLEKATEDAYDANALGESRYARTQRADPAHHEVDVDSRLRCPVECLNHRRVGKRIELGADARRSPRPPPGAPMLSLAIDQRQHTLQQRGWRDEQVPQLNLRRMTRSGQLVEQRVHIGRD